MKKNGWGLRTELLFILMFIVCLVVATIGLNRIGFIGGTFSAIDMFNGKDTKESYIMIENDLVKVAANYATEYYGGKYPEDEFTIRLTTLINTGYTSKLTDPKNRECSGYVDVKKVNSSLIYTPYIKCATYRTEGYKSNKDW